MRCPQSSAVAALILASGCFNPEPPAGADTDVATSGETDALGSGDQDEPEPEPEPEPGTTSAEAPDETSTGAPEDEGSCGDGVVQGGEECDLGSDNDDDGACTHACTIAVCGDGYVHQGAEVCYDGEASALCDLDCTIPQCGDGVTNPLAFEQCDGDDVMNGYCESCVAICNPGWSRCGGGPAAPCDAVIASQASCISCGHVWREQTIVSSEHVSLDSQFGPMPGMPFVQSARWASNTVTGWIGFDLEDTAPIFLVDAKLEFHVNYLYMSPMSDVVIDPSPGWSAADLQPGSVLIADFMPFNPGFHSLDLELDTWDWAASSRDGWLSLGFVPRGPMDTSLELEGSGFPDLAPRLRITGCF